ncbi:MAG: terminase large subunit [Patulibacter sp.]
MSAPAAQPAAVATRAPHFSWFCQTYLQHSIGRRFVGRPVEFEPWQEEFWTEALTVDQAGMYLWLSIALVLPRKNGKTTMLAAYALYRLLYDEDQPEILLAASSDKQAGRLFDSVVAFIRRSPELQDLLVVRSYIGEIARRDGGGVILRMSSSPERLHGYNPSLVICDEVAQWTTPNLRKAWEALTTGGGAREDAQTFTISTAGEGHTRADGILGRLIDGNEREGEVERRGSLTISRNLDGQTLVFNYAAATTSRADIPAIKAANPAGWITTRFLARQAANPELSEAAFLQLHGCVWSEGDSQWIAADQWRSVVRGGADSALADGDVISLGFDGSRLYDATVLVACRLHDRLIVPLKCWERPYGAAGEGWEVPADDVLDTLRDAHNRFRVARGYYDPPYWATDIDGWALEFGAKVVVKFPTASSSRMPAALQRFKTDVLTRTLGHNGNKTMHRMVVNARMESTRGGYKLVKPGKHPEDRIDGAVAAVLAYEAASDAIAAGGLKRKPRLIAIPD